MPRTAQRFDFIPKDFVYTATLGGGAPNRPARTGIVQRVNQQERTCDVQWLYDAGGPKLETGISCYDIELLNVRYIPPPLMPMPDGVAHDAIGVPAQNRAPVPSRWASQCWSIRS